MSWVQLIHTAQKFHVKCNAIPRFLKARPVLFAIKSSMEAEFDQIHVSGIITLESHSGWAVSIVPVHKTNGQFCNYRDYKVTINSSSEVDQYPLPKPDDLFTNVCG